jgi:hypothetical protein
MCFAGCSKTSTAVILPAGRFFLIEVVCGEIHLRLPNGFRAALTRLQDRPDHQDQRGGDQTSRHDELFRPSGEAPGKLDVSLQPSPRFIH